MSELMSYFLFSIRKQINVNNLVSLTRPKTCIRTLHSRSIYCRHNLGKELETKKEKMKRREKRVTRPSHNLCIGH